MLLFKKGISLQLLIGWAIFSAMFLLSLLLIAQSYQSNKQALLLATSETAQQLGQTINEKAQRITGPAQSALQILSHDPLLEAKNLPQRLKRLPVLAETLASNSVLSAIYAGYDNGEFFLLRILNTALKQKYQVPDNAQYLLQTITVKNGTKVGEWHFYNQDLTIVSSEVKADYQYDPRGRSWYMDAQQHQGQILTAPYLFFTTKEIGITLATRSPQGDAVIGMDASITDLSAQLTNLRLTPNSELTIIDKAEKVLAYSDTRRMLVQEGDNYRLSSLDQLGIDIFQQLTTANPAAGKIHPIHLEGQDWYTLWIPVSTFLEAGIKVLIAVPEAELLARAKEEIYNQLSWAILLTIVMLLLGLYTGSRIGRSFKQLTLQVRDLANFNFHQVTGVDSQIKEVQELNQVVDKMSLTINHFQAISSLLNRESDLEKMLKGVLEHMVQATGLQQGAIYLFDADNQRFQQACQTSQDSFPKQLAYQEEQLSLVPHILEQLARAEQCLVTPLRKRNQELEGLLIIRAKRDVQHHDHLNHFIEHLSGSAAVAIETRRLIHGQKEMIEGILRLLADAIDAKSPYTSRHCERVPELANDLIQNLMRQDTGPFADFTMDEQQQEAFRVAAWLHDCGKILSQEHVIDKATKLETLYNRIHEVRARFEILWRDAELDYWQQRAQGQDENALKQQLLDTQHSLQQEFAFIARINQGQSGIKPDDLARIDEIGDRTWFRHFDNRLGLSHEELSQLVDQPIQSLPVQEQLLSDRPEHLVLWQEGHTPPVTPDDPNNQWQFNMTLPKYAFNFGERYNLSIPYGTLTEEERFKINEHIVHTIVMLSGLPLPDHLKEVPKIAGNHHERMDGRGYPRGLSADQMSVPEKVMAIADIFEALTARDRPYKQANTLSESLQIMVSMTLNGHIDHQVFTLLLQNQAFEHFSQQYLSAEQIDEIDIKGLLAQLEPMNAIA